MKDITGSIPNLHPLALVITARAIGLGVPILAADFRDTKSLYSNKLNTYLGFRNDLRIVPISEQFTLKNGFWYASVVKTDCYLPILELDLIIKEWS